MIIVLNILLLLILFTSYVICSSLAVFVMIIIRMLLCTNKPLRHRFTMRIKHLWLSLTVTLLGFYFVHPTYVCFDKSILKQKKCILLSNHLTNYDWIYLLVIFNKLKMYEDIVIILKESLSNMPIYGYGMKVFGYIFLKREWNKDQEILAQGLKRMREKDKYFLLLFPEGTFIDSQTHPKSKKFCESNNVIVDSKPFDSSHVLLPRKTGFEMIYQNLNGTIDGIVDVTLLINPYQNYPSEDFVLWDVFIKRSKRLKFCCLLEFVEKSEVSQKDWLYKNYFEKDKIIEKYRLNDGLMNLNEFKEKSKILLKKDTDNYNYETVYIWCDYSKYYLIGLFLTFMAIGYYILK